jgi:hypothetical protein
MDDLLAVEVQLDRPLRAVDEVVSRCHLGLPVVIAVPPILDDGTPFPTRYWLTCPLAKRRIGRLESAGGVKAMDRLLATDRDFADRLQRSHERYAAERDCLIPEAVDHRPEGGVGGITGAGVKCLHAHYADTRAGNDNPVGEMVVPWVEPLDCEVPCVIQVGGEVERNRGWMEPR